MKHAGRLFVLIVATLLLAFTGATTAFAATTPTTDADYWFSHTFGGFNTIITQKSVNGNLQLEGGSAANLNNNFNALGGAFFGLCDSGTATTATGGECPFGLDSSHALLNRLSTSVIALYVNPPATTYDFAMDAGQTLGFIPKQTYAQGIGFSGLAAMLPLWKQFRDVAYLLLAVSLIIVGFMVMFRKKIDPKTVVTVQNAIPRIVVALILVTFSYAIVGVMIDLMYLSIVVVVSILAPASGGAIKSSEFAGQLLGGGFGNVIANMAWFGKNIFLDITNLLSGGNPTVKVITPIVTGIIGLMVTGNIKGAVIGAASIPALLIVVIGVVLLFGIIRLLFVLVDAYINIIIALLTAPLQLMAEAIPGTNAFSSWFRNLIAKLSVFPITAMFLLISGILSTFDQTSPLWSPPILSKSGGTYGIGGLIGLGMLLVIPNITAAIQKALKAEPAVPGGLGPVIGPVTSGFGQLFTLGYQASFIAGAIRHKPDVRSPMQTLREGSDKGFGAVTGGGGGGH
jgi:hypothetical protein